MDIPVSRIQRPWLRRAVIVVSFVPVLAVQMVLCFFAAGGLAWREAVRLASSARGQW